MTQHLYMNKAEQVLFYFDTIIVLLEGGGPPLESDEVSADSWPPAWGGRDRPPVKVTPPAGLFSPSVFAALNATMCASQRKQRTSVIWWRLKCVLKVLIDQCRTLSLWFLHGIDHLEGISTRWGQGGISPSTYLPRDSVRRNRGELGLEKGLHWSDSMIDSLNGVWLSYQVDLNKE